MRTRRSVLAAVLLGAVAVVPALAAPRQAVGTPPRTGFEERNGETWTTHDEELAFLAAVDAMSARVSIEVIGESVEGKPLHLVKLGVPAPRTPAQAVGEPVELHVCTQHGNEPAGREACLMALRDLAFSTDAEVVAQLSEQTLLFVPTANPDGRETNGRENAEGIDINRDHLNLASPEAQALAKVIRDWQPDISIDHHEYGPGTPVLYDDEVLYLWPRNLNVDDQVHDLGVAFSKEVLAPCLATAGFTSDEYGIDAVGSTDVQQTAGGGDEGILRNAAGLRHVVGILVESAVTMNPTNGPGEVTTAGQQLRRVASQRSTIDCTLDYMRSNGEAIASATSGAGVRKTIEGRDRSAPVYFAGQDEDTTAVGNGDETVSVDPPPCGYDLDAEQLKSVAEILDLHAIAAVPRGKGARVSMAQPAEPVIPLLLDERNADRAETDATALETCAASSGTTASPRPEPPRAGPGRKPDDDDRIPTTGAPAAVAVVAALSTAVAVTLRRQSA